jgi:hypothetical protein
VNRISSILTGLSLAILFFVGSAHAQYDGQRMTANVPFEFTVGSISFPAGQYEFVRTGPNLVLIRDADGRSMFTVASAAIEAGVLPGKSALKFATVDGHHVLVQIWNDVAGSGNEFLNGNTSVELSKFPATHDTVTDRR